MARAHANKEVPHLFAGLIALGLAAIVLFAAERILIHLEHATIVSTAPDTFTLKNQGLVFQRAAAHAPNVLPIYGSSELLVPRGSGAVKHFFSHCADRLPTFARWQRRCEPAHHVAKGRLSRLGFARQKSCHLSFTWLVFHRQA